MKPVALARLAVVVELQAAAEDLGGSGLDGVVAVVVLASCFRLLHVSMLLEEEITHTPASTPHIIPL